MDTFLLAYYINALENGSVRPSLGADTFLLAYYVDALENGSVRPSLGADTLNALEN